MTFKWTYIAAVVVFSSAVILMVRDGEGVFGGVGYAMGLGLIVVAAVLVFLSRTRGRSITAGSADSDVPFLSYPEHQVLAILDTRDCAADAIREIRGQDIMADLHVYYGSAGGTAIDSRGVAHGVVGVVERSVERLVADLDDMIAYDDAVRSGKVVVSFDGSDEDTRARGAKALIGHGGHTIQYFGSFSIEELDVDRTRTRMSVDPTKEA